MYAKFFGSPKSGLPTPPAASFRPTGISTMPRTVITVPVTTGGNSLMIVRKALGGSQAKAKVAMPRSPRRR